MKPIARSRKRLGAVLAGSLLVATSLLAVSVGSPAAEAGPLSSAHVELQQVASGLTKPVAMAWRSGDPRMYVAEQTGRVRLVDTDGTLLPTPVLVLTVGSGGERGLLGLDFSADGSKLYVDYTGVDGTIRIVEYQMLADTADTATARELLAIPHPLSNHNGGQLMMGDDDTLYISVGDGGGSGDPQGNGQNLNTLLGKILRIDPTPSGGLPYTVPPDNPFVGQAGVRPEIWMYGLRNPWKFSFDRDTGDMWIGDVGQGLYEEVDYAPAGQSGTNWGWSLREGFHQFKGAQPPDGQDPLFEETHDDGNCALIGGHVYRGDVIDALAGAYVYIDFCRGRFTAVTQSGGAVTEKRELGLQAGQVSGFGEDHDGELYVSRLNGTISKIVPAQPSLAIGDASVVEGSAGASMVAVPVTLSSESVNAVSVNWKTVDGTAKTPGDYEAGDSSLVIPAGETQGEILVPIAGDEVNEKTEKFTVKLSGIIGANFADTIGTVNVLDDDGPISVSVSDSWINEGVAGASEVDAVVSLSRPVPAGSSVSVKVSTADGTALAGSDYTSVPSTTLTFSPGEQSKTVAVAVIGDGTVEKSETFKFNLKTPVGGVVADSFAKITIVNDDGTPTEPPAPSLSTGDAAVVEGHAGTTIVAVPITLTAPSLTEVTADWQLTDSSAKAPGDYTDAFGSLTIPAGETAATVEVSVVGDEAMEAMEKFTLRLSNLDGASMADAAGLVYVLDDDGPISASVSDASVIEGNSGAITVVMTVSLSRPVPSGGSVSVTASTTDGSADAGLDYTAVAPTVLSFSPGEQSKTVSVDVIGDTAIEANETVKVYIKTPVNAVVADSYGLITIVTDD